MDEPTAANETGATPERGYEPSCVLAWEHFPHVADIGVRGFGADPATAFENAALAMTAVITDPAAIRPAIAVAIQCRADDRELLLLEWLNALVFEMATRRMLFGRFGVTLDGDGLTATAWGEPVDIARHQPTVEVKGATLTELKVEQAADGRWLAQCVVDV